ncbi:MAG: thiamine pyrophosphokinae [Hyphomicrobiales bacterium]|nr:thiamine pyrophosphokinae [Hyphomicrobiales bacterium]
MQELSQKDATDLPLTFPGVLVIVGGGAVDLDLLAQLAAGGAALVGADGGGDVIAGAGLKPNAIIGDFDSLSDPLGWLGRTRLVRISEQETTDFEKALYSTRAPVTVALGMTGKRFDHTLAALDAVTRYARQRSIILVDESDIALAVSGSFSFGVKAGERVSVHPLQPVLFRSSDGLKYPLEGLRLAPGERTGTSNSATKRTFVIEPAKGEDGVWLLILEKGNLAGLIEAVMNRRG